MNEMEIKELILRYKNKVNLKLCSSDYAKGYCYGVASESANISATEYDELSKIIDDIFDGK